MYGHGLHRLAGHDELHRCAYRHRSLNYFASKCPGNYAKVWRAEVPGQGSSCSSRTKAGAPGHPRGSSQILPWLLQIKVAH